MPAFSLTLATLVVTAAVTVGQGLPARPDLSAYADGFAAWEEEVTRLEALDRTTPDPDGAVLLIGSSSIRLWDSAAADLAPFPVIRRGYGGAKFCDLAHYAERLVTPHRYRAAVVFVANDIDGGPRDKSPEEVAGLFRHVAGVLQTHQPGAWVVCCDVRPTPLRWTLWPKIRRVNGALRAECARRERTAFLDTSADFLTPDGTRPRADLYGEDGLHLNGAGYGVWSARIKGELDRLLPAP